MALEVFRVDSHLAYLRRPRIALSSAPRKELDREPPSQDIAAEMLSSMQDFQSAAAINAVLGRILAMLAAGRLKPREARCLA
jgi:hypothetical protein